MQFSMFPSLLVLASLAATPADASQASPVKKVLEMLSGLQQHVIAVGTEAQTIYDKYAEWCEDNAQKLGFEIKSGRADVAESKATIEAETSNTGALAAKIEELSADIQTDEADLKAADGIRKKESADFSAEEKELTEIISMLERATSILSKKSAASMLQMGSAKSLTEALSTMVEASVISSADVPRLTALAQIGDASSSADSDSDSSMGAPAAATYEDHSGGIVGTLEGLTEKANGQLDKARKAEATSLQNYLMLKQSLTDAVTFAQNDMDKAKKDMAASQEKRAIAQGELEVSSKDLQEDLQTKQTLHQDCMMAADEFQLSTKSRGEELDALASARKIIQQSTGGADEQTYGLNQMSFLQLQRARLSSGADLAQAQVVRLIRDLARKTQSTGLTQLLSRMSSAMRLGAAGGADPFDKVKSLLTDMIATLEDDAATEASHKAYCDKELAASTEKKQDLTSESNAMSTKIAQARSASKKLKGQVATLQNQLASAAKALAQADQLRATEKAAYDNNSAQMEQGVEGIQMALKILKEYYATGDNSHEASLGAGNSIIGALEVCESDFTKSLAEMTAEEEAAASAHNQYVKEGAVATAAKEADVKFKTKIAASLDKSVSEYGSDLASASDELRAVMSGLEKLNDMCIAKSLPYEERKRRREAELAGLKQAQEILDGSVALLQKATKHTLRGVRSHTSFA